MSTYNTKIHWLLMEIVRTHYSNTYMHVCAHTHRDLLARNCKLKGKKKQQNFYPAFPI